MSNPAFLYGNNHQNDVIWGKMKIRQTSEIVLTSLKAKNRLTYLRSLQTRMIGCNLFTYLQFRNLEVLILKQNILSCHIVFGSIPSTLLLNYLRSLRTQMLHVILHTYLILYCWCIDDLAVLCPILRFNLLSLG